MVLCGLGSEILRPYRLRMTILGQPAETCPDCDEKLVDSLPEEESEEEPKLDEEIELALLCTTSHPVYAEFLKQSLTDNGIPCLLKRGTLDFLGGFYGGVGSIDRVYIPKDKLEEAKRIKDQTIDNL